MFDSVSVLVIVAILAGSLVGAVIFHVFAQTLLDSLAARFRRWLADRGKAPLLPAKYHGRLGGTSGEKNGQHYCGFVSRHHLAEGGLDCPLCQWHIADAGDFSKVYRVAFDGRENECVVCPGEREVENGRRVACQAILLASPDTEHGDHLNDKGEVDAYAPDPPEFFRFVRTDADAGLREKWGADAKSDGGDAVLAPEDPIARAKASLDAYAKAKDDARAAAQAVGAPPEVAEALAIGARPAKSENQVPTAVLPTVKG
jgi:hypothetical protein